MGDVARTSFMTDMGVSISVAGMQFAQKLGIKEDDLLQSSMQITSADGSPISVLGSVMVDLRGFGEKTQGAGVHLPQDQGLPVDS